MSRGNFPPYLFRALMQGLTVSDAKIEGPVAVLTSRIADCNPEMLKAPHSSEPCSKCGHACVIHPETLRVAENRVVICHGCADAMNYEPQKVVMHPLSAMDTIVGINKRKGDT